MNSENLKQENSKDKKENSFKEIVKFTLITLAIVIPFRAYIAEPFVVNGASMDPTFKTGEYLIVDQVTYHWNEPKRGDVIVFKYPINDSRKYLIKRIIGLPNETISVNNGKIKIINKENPNGIILDDVYVIENHKTRDTFTKTLGSLEYFVMGDNRAESSDSRLWGPLESKYIVGRPILRLLPFSKISILPGI